MKLIDNPGKVLKRAWSLWLAYLAAIFAALDQTHTQLVDALPILQPYLTDQQFGALSLLCTVLIPVARIIDQGIKAANAAGGSN